MTQLINHEKKYIILVPPKNGCSTVKKMFCEFNNISENNDSDFQSIGNKSTNNYNDYKIFFIYRNIFERFFSFCRNILYNNFVFNNRNDIDFITFLNEYKKYIGKKMNSNTKIKDVIKFLHYLNVDNIYKDSIDGHYLSNTFYLNNYCDQLEINSNNIEIINIYQINNIIFDYLQNVHNNFSINKIYENVSISELSDTSKDIVFKKITISNIYIQKQNLMKDHCFLNEIMKLYSCDYNLIKKCYNIDEIDEIDKYNKYTITKDNSYLKLLPNDFDYKTYKLLHSDLYLYNNEMLAKHYITYGYKENRKYKYEHIPYDFNAKEYLLLNEDLQHITEVEAKNHYEYEGYKENRKYKYEHIPDDFNAKEYLLLNDDLQHMTEVEAKNHYEYNGYKEENRKYKYDNISDDFNAKRMIEVEAKKHHLSCER